MKKTILAISVIAASAVTAFAADDPVAARKAIMQSVGGAAGASGAMMKGEVAYSPAVGKAAITAVHAAAMTFGDYFPEGSDMGADTTAAPKIWEDMAGFEAEIAKLQEASAAAVAASGRAGPADLDAFKAAMGPVLGTCKSCHEGYRVQN